jgi:signal transduction histidine kinase
MIDEVGGEERGTVYVLHDIAERLEWERALEESQDQLRQAQKMEAIGRLSGGIAHDFNNLLTVIMGYTRLLGQGLEGLEADRRAPLLADLEGVNKAAHRSIALTRQLLAFSRQQVLSPKIVDINRIVADLEKMLRRLLSENIGLNITRRARDAYVYVDEGQMEQVLMNLVVNARDAMETTGIIAIRTGTLYLEDSVPTQSGEAPAGAYVVVSVEDTGSGISEKTLEHIFDPFFTTKERGQGTGLGLSTVYGIVQQSGGYISVETEERRGTTFRIMLPRVSSERTERSEDQPARSALEGSETLLLVEDDPSIRTLLTRVLSDRGYRVVQAQNAGEAVLICENENLNIDLLISDIIMPHVTGLDLAKRMRKTRPELRVLLISGYPEEISESMSTETDFSYLQKPFDPETLLAKARKILDS